MRHRTEPDPGPARETAVRRPARDAAAAAGAALIPAVLLAMNGNPAVSAVQTVAHWPLMALTLFWTAQRRQDLYARGALALLLSSAAGFGVFASTRPWSPHETALVEGYLDMPGVRASWYVLTALVLGAAVTAAWARAAVVAVIALVVASAALTAERPVLGALLAGGVPVLAWQATALLPDRRPDRRHARGASPGADSTAHRQVD
ncbi:hypothetical protein ADL00_35825 [Streptomyces sp. AS58]|uniref:hypothetical protein n=1 Tax=Streptomyces sp. AS58 TaxID=1519489 RepID=UPI0006AE43E5|nr:hypothetical protein [Streptomyces sp. AS58]KOV52820.1 hypothetical protein ADL00_35825 [Streptomyces sp. AS58]